MNKSLLLHGFYAVYRFNKNCQYKLIPVAKNTVIIRVENLADRFDQDSETHYIDMYKLANDLF